MRKIAVIGSRGFPSADAPALKVNELYGEHGQFILVSGGAAGPSTVAEKTALGFGMPVISFRPVKLLTGANDEYGVDEWRLFKGAGTIVHHNAPTWATWDGAAWFRGLLIAERADEGFAFWDGRSRGTAFEIDAFAAADTPLEIVKA